MKDSDLPKGRPVWLTPPTSETDHSAQWSCVLGFVLADCDDAAGIWRIDTRMTDGESCITHRPAAFVAEYAEERVWRLRGVPEFSHPPTEITHHGRLLAWQCVQGRCVVQVDGNVWRVRQFGGAKSHQQRECTGAEVVAAADLVIENLGGLAPAKPAEPAPTLESRVAALEAQMAAMATAPTIQPDLTVEPEWHEAPLVNGVLRDWVRNRVRAYKPEGGWMVILMDKDQFAVRTWEDLTPANAALVVRVLCGVLP